MNKNKSDLQKALEVVKNLVFASNKPKNITSKVKFKFEIVEDAEGKTITYPALEVGAPVEISGAEGSQVAPDGNYQVEGDIQITVTDGLISEIVQPESAEEFEEGDEPKAEVENPEAIEEIVSVVNDAVEEIEAIKEENEALKEELEAIKVEVAEFSKMGKDIKALTSAVAKFSKEPVATSVTKQDDFSPKGDSKEDKMKALANRINRK